MFARFNLGDITIKHHYTKQGFHLHSFTHKGYWFHGMNRERSTMMLFSKLIDEGDTVVEVGGHIGYITLYFAHLVGNSGRVIVLEPGPNNLPYLLKNTSSNDNILVVQKAAGAIAAQLPFYVENLTGQNNTLVPGFRRLADNARFAHIKTDYKPILVDVVPLDEILPQREQKIDFLKIDVEGAELAVLTGADDVICRFTPKIMIESNNTGLQLFEYLSNRNYCILSPDCKVIDKQWQMGNGNYFCLHSTKHEKAIRNLVI